VVMVVMVAVMRRLASGYSGGCRGYVGRHHAVDGRAQSAGRVVAHAQNAGHVIDRQHGQRRAAHAEPLERLYTHVRTIYRWNVRFVGFLTI